MEFTRVLPSLLFVNCYTSFISVKYIMNLYTYTYVQIFFSKLVKTFTSKSLITWSAFMEMLRKI